MRITKTFGFEAAHYLPSAPPGHPNRRIHGHSFSVRVTLAGKPDANGLVMHFERVEATLEGVRRELDHNLLNDIAGLDDPTLERITLWLWRRLAPALPGLAAIELSRPSCGEACLYEGDDE